jgi:predicted RNA-binding Zn-ribbon protein involved in translation (DUF1610 family)
MSLEDAKKLAAQITSQDAEAIHLAAMMDRDTAECLQRGVCPECATQTVEHTEPWFTSRNRYKCTKCGGIWIVYFDGYSISFSIRKKK